jgi:DNA-binding SARP family transcriptional activator/Tfp pilus assembly protein PilF
MEFGLLGPLVVRCDGLAVQIAGGRQRAVLAALLLDAGRVVPVADLAAALWGPAPPASARVSVQNYVRRLRQALGDAGPARIETRPGGYRITVAPGELDVARFEELAAAARDAARAGSWADAAARSRAALALWRGEPLADAGSETLALAVVPRLAELRRQALNTRIEADLHAGRHAEVIAELVALIAAEPLRERWHGLLMLALYRDDRPGEALAAYEQARRVLAAELGVEPGAGLRKLHGQILAADPELAVPARLEPAAGRPEPGPAGPAPQSPAPAAGGVVPRQLPGAVAHFAGRAGELAVLSGWLDQADAAGPGVAVISAIGGTAGVGKTALAVRWGHQVADRFPDGQLYVNLRGYDPGPPVTAAEALAGFLSALGMAGPAIPDGAEERAARFRSLVAGRRVLVVLDNAREVEQVRLLLPGSPGCMVVVTSRDALTGLVARDGASRLELGLLPIGDAVALLRALVGSRVDADPAVAVALAEQCARLPLALRVAAELAAAAPASSLRELAGELTGLQRLDRLDAGGDPRTAVRAVFSWSYRSLEPAAARTFALLGLHPGPDFDRYAVAALAGTSAAAAGQVLAALARAYLVQPAGPGRYGMHDLLREYAAEQAAGPAGTAALTRLFDYYLHAASAAMDLLHPAERDRRPRIPGPAGPVPPLGGPAAAQSWLNGERAVLVTMAGYAAARGWPGHAARLSPILFRYLDVGGHYPDAVTIHDQARRAARQAGDQRAEANALANLGIVYWRQSRNAEAGARLQEALALFRAAGDGRGEARALSSLGLIHQQAGRIQEAADHYERSLTRYRAEGDRFSQALILGNLGIVEERRGRHERAASLYREALALYRDTGDRAGEARALDNLGSAEQRLGRYQQAAEHNQQALILFRVTGDRYGEASALGNLGIVAERQGRYEQAIDLQRQALARYREIGNRNCEAEALNGLGGSLLGAGQDDAARIEHTAALELAREIGDRQEQARAHDGLARAWSAAGDTTRARAHWQAALPLYAGLGAPEADAVRARLADPEPAPAGPGDDRTRSNPDPGGG